jgi:acyl-[acyl-carrier-protein]-phospholipid O-acyltransferase/long-chain-fatty-acid--[acyl-carrier-protein] ligase
MKKTTLENLVLPRRFLRMCRKRMRASKVADSSGVDLSGAELLTRTFLVRKFLRRHVYGPVRGQRVGILLPPSVACIVVNAALAIDSQVAVNLNYTVTSEVMNDCIAQCGVHHIVTSRRVMERFDLELNANLVYLEDIPNKIRWLDKIAAAATAWLAPIAWLERWLGLTEIGDDDLLTVIFTSGSTGQPKGVMLTHRNVGSNMIAVNQIMRLSDSDVLLGILPIFHSFGYTITLWMVLSLSPKGIYHFNPLEAREVGKLCRTHGATILVSTPTFVRSYLRRCDVEDLASLDVVFTGAERLASELADAFEEKFGVRPVEGYGMTELSPVVSANMPPSRATGKDHEGVKEGTVGRPLPGISAKVIDLDSGEDLGPNCSGMLLITGPNVMKGYYGRPDLTAEVIRDGWYITGDVAEIDTDGFIKITGRISRFSKIGGEMVPHIRVEEAICKALHLYQDDLQVVVTAVPDAKKGERLVVLYTELKESPDQICRQLVDDGLPALWIPSTDSFRHVDAIPVLGTGKLDLKRLKEVAEMELNPMADEMKIAQ